MRVCIVCRSEPPLDDIVAVLYQGRVIDWCVCLPCHQREQGIPPAAFGRSTSSDHHAGRHSHGVLGEDAASRREP